MILNLQTIGAVEARRSSDHNYTMMYCPVIGCEVAIRVCRETYKQAVKSPINSELVILLLMSHSHYLFCKPSRSFLLILLSLPCYPIC